MRIHNQRIKTTHKTHKTYKSHTSHYSHTSHKPQRTHKALVLGLTVINLLSPFQAIQVYAAPSTSSSTSSTTEVDSNTDQSVTSIYGSTTYKIDDTTEIVYPNIISLPYDDTLEITAAAPPTEIPTKENYTFLGWHDSSVEHYNITSSYEELNSPYGITYVKDILASTSDGTKVKGAIDEEENSIFSSVMNPNNITPVYYEFYATWGRIKYNTNGGKFKDGSTEKYTSIESTPANLSESNQYEIAKYYTKEFITEKPTREGYIFLGWSPLDYINGHNTYDETNYNKVTTLEELKYITENLLFQDSDGYVKYKDESGKTVNLALTNYNYFTVDNMEAEVQFPTELPVYAVWIKESLIPSDTSSDQISDPYNTSTDTNTNTDTNLSSENSTITNTESTLQSQPQSPSLKIDEYIPEEDLYVGNTEDTETTKTAMSIFKTVMKGIAVVASFSLVLPLVGLVILLYIKERAKKIELKNDVNTDEYNNPDFKSIRTLKAQSEENLLTELKRDANRNWKVRIPESVITERVTDYFELKLTKAFSKHYNGEELMIILENSCDDKVITLSKRIDAYNNIIEFRIEN